MGMLERVRLLAKQGASKEGIQSALLQGEGKGSCGPGSLAGIVGPPLMPTGGRDYAVKPMGRIEGIEGEYNIVQVSFRKACISLVYTYMHGSCVYTTCMRASNKDTQ